MHIVPKPLRGVKKEREPGGNGCAVKQLYASVAARRRLNTNSVPWSTGMLDAILSLSLARLFLVLDDIGASEGEPRLQHRREASCDRADALLRFCNARDTLFDGLVYLI